jgi:hypothetical protein
MSVSAVWVKHSLVLQPVALASPVVLGALTRLSMPTGTTLETDQTDPTLFPDFISIGKRKPTMAWGTTAIARYLTNLGLGATCINSDVSHPGLAAYFQKRLCNGPASGSVHESFTYGSGLVVPAQLSVSHRSPAQLSYSFMSQYRSTAAAVIRTSGVALPSLPVAAAEKYDLYEFAVGGSAFGQRTSVSIDFNPRLYELGADGEIEDSFIALESFYPRITARGFSLPSFGSFDLDGQVCAHGDSHVILRKRGVALTTAEHVKITFQGLATVDMIHEADKHSPSEDTIMVDCGQDASNGAFVFDETYAIE